MIKRYKIRVDPRSPVLDLDGMEVSVDQNTLVVDECVVSYEDLKSVRFDATAFVFTPSEEFQQDIEGWVCVDTRDGSICLFVDVLVFSPGQAVADEAFDFTSTPLKPFFRLFGCNVAPGQDLETPLMHVYQTRQESR